MTLATKRAGLAAAIAVLIGAGACSKSSSTKPLDDALKADLAAAGGNSSDLQLAGATAKPQVVVSAIEGGPTSAPAKAAPTRVAKPSSKPVTRTPAPAPTTRAAEAPPAPVEKAPVMEAPSPAPAPAAQAPAPAPAPREDHRVYKTEGEIFRQMPWIRP